VAWRQHHAKLHGLSLRRIGIGQLVSDLFAGGSKFEWKNIRPCTLHQTGQERESGKEKEGKGQK
jgi:hypothetical protein